MSYSSKMMNIPFLNPDGRFEDGSIEVACAKVGHKLARHAAAEIANEADAEIERLKERNEKLLVALREADKYLSRNNNKQNYIGCESILHQMMRAAIAEVEQT